MVRSLPSVPSTQIDPPAAERILAAAELRLLNEGYVALTMDLLAEDLGMSKKTIYAHFDGKDSLVAGVIDRIESEIRAGMDAVLSRKGIGFTERLCGVLEVASATFGRIKPATFRQLQRSAPPLYRKVEDIRARMIPYVFGRLVREGIAAGKVRSDIDPDFLVEFWLQAMQGLAHPDTLERTQLTLRQTLERATRIFFAGLLTEAGRDEFTRNMPSLSKPSSR